MKKQLCVMAAACGLLSLASCSEDENVIINDQPEVLAGEQVITLNVQETDVLSTKSRPLYSTEAQGAERVTDVKLFVFKVKKGENTTSKPMELARIFHIQNWDGSSEDYRYGREYGRFRFYPYRRHSYEDDKQDSPCAFYFRNQL